MTLNRQIILDVHPSAMRAVTEQADYFAIKANSALARRWELAVDETIHSLLTFPAQGRLCQLPFLSVTDLRRIAIPGFTKYLLFYRHVEHQNSLTVVHVTHGSRDYLPALSATLSE